MAFDMARASRHVLAPVCLSLCFLAACSVAKEPAPRIVPEEPTAVAPVPSELDLLIARLPPVGSERIQQNGKWELKPDPAEMKARIEAGEVLSEQQWKRALVGVGVLRVPSRWPGSQPFVISMKQSVWLRVTRITLLPNTADLRPARVGLLYDPACGNHADASAREWEHQVLGSLSPGHHSLGFTVTIERGKPLRSPLAKEPPVVPPPGLVWHGEMVFDVEVY